MADNEHFVPELNVFSCELLLYYMLKYGNVISLQQSIVTHLKVKIIYKFWPLFPAATRTYVRLHVCM